MWMKGSLNENGDDCDEDRKYTVDVCCLLELRWNMKSSSMFEMVTESVVCG